MHLTDACVLPHPLGDSTIRRMALAARELGIDSLVAIGVEKGALYDVEVVGGAALEGPDVRRMSKAMAAQRNASPVFLVKSGDNSFNRALLGLPKAFILRGLHCAPRNAFDHILAKQATVRGVAVDIELLPLIQLRGPARQKVIQRYADLARLQNRFGFSFTISSGARSVLEMRSARDMAALCSLFGLDEEVTMQSLGTVDRLMNPEGPVRVVE